MASQDGVPRSTSQRHGRKGLLDLRGPLSHKAAQQPGGGKVRAEYPAEEQEEVGGAFCLAGKQHRLKE